MAFDYEKLTADVRKAMKAGEQAAAAVNDRGTCNMDGVVLRLPRLREQRVVDALSQAGVYTNKSGCGWAGPGYMINPNCGQADKRSTAAKAIEASLKQAGYDVTMFYMMD